MDAATPLRRWLRTAGLLAVTAVGCQSSEATSAPPVARSQAPVPASAPGTPADPVQPAGFSPGGPGLIRPTLPTGTPRVKVVAVVGAGNIVTDREVWEAVKQGREWADAIQLIGAERDAREQELYRAALRGIIDRELILDDMYTRLKKNGKLAAIEELKEMATKAADQQVRAIKKQVKARSDDEFREMLASQEMTLPVFRRAIERQIMADEYVRGMLKEKGLAAGLAEVREYYDRHPDEFRTAERVKWQDVFVSFARFNTPREAYDHAEAVRRYAETGVDFAAVSKQYDQGFAAQQNGEGAGTERGKIQPPDVEPTVWSLPVGQVSPLIQTPTGYHIVKVVEREVAGVRPFDEKVQSEVRARLREQTVRQERARLLDTLWRKGTVQVIGAP